MEWRRGSHTVSDERARVDLDVVHADLARSYWAEGIPRELLVDSVDAHPELQNLRRWMLVTRDAHGLYERVGWRALAEPSRHMERTVRDAYRR